MSTIDEAYSQNEFLIEIAKKEYRSRCMKMARENIRCLKLQAEYMQSNNTRLPEHLTANDCMHIMKESIADYEESLILKTIYHAK